MGIFRTLASHAREIDRELERAIPRGKKPAEVYGLIWELLDRGGKRFRPTLCLLSCEAVGGRRKEAMPAACSIELFHNFTLIHDDIEDGSLMRRGRPTLHKLYGIPLAINAGDGLFMMVWKPLLNLDKKPAQTLAAQHILLSAFTRVLEGQATELNWHRNKNWRLSEKDYFRMAEGKTAALLSAACEVGAFLGGGSGSERKALLKFGRDVGIAFQIQDDILNLVGKESKYGKEIGGDITEGKRTLMTLHYMKHAGVAERKRMAALLDSKTTSPATLKKTIALLEQSGSVGYAKAQARSFALGAKRSLSKLKKNAAVQKLNALADFLIERDF